jgi:4-amino-4-deoxy-L-arabinose transferase-like glycosyltransferase
MMTDYSSKFKNTHPVATLILFTFVILAVIYSIVNPIFEAGDESRHYAVVKYMADTGRLPIQQPGEAQIHWSHEGNQPPLYYALAAALTFWIDTSSWDDVYWYNPHTTIGNPLRADNKNIVIHPPAENWPWRAHSLAVHLIRFLSIAMAAVTVMVSYFIALSLFGGRRGLAAGAMAITAFNPMFIFISASVNNDNAVIMFTTLALWLMVRISEPPRSINIPRYAAGLGLLIGLGALSKLYALGLLPLAGALFVWLACRAESPPKFTIRCLKNATVWKQAIIWTAVMTLTAVAVGGWFYARNALLYNGDALALQVMRDTAGQREQIPSLATLRAEFQGFRIAYWALFGGVNILADDWIYPILDWVSLAAVIGVIVLVTRRSSLQIRHSSFVILLGWYLIMIAGFIVWNLTQPAGQGRLMYPAIAAISALGLLGLTWWLPTRGQTAMTVLCAAGLFAFAAISPFRYMAPAYAPPPILTQADLPADVQPVNFTYNSNIRLLGYQLHADTVRPAQSLPITLYWQIVQPTAFDYSIFVHLLGRQREVVGQLDSYPGGGHRPTTLLQPGDILADRYDIAIKPEAEYAAPARLQIAAGVYDYHEPGRPGKPAVNTEGQPVEPIIGVVKLVPWQWPAPPPGESPVNFFDKITLLNRQLDPAAQTLTLTWQVNQPPGLDYTVFIQAWQADTNEYVIGFDGPPVQGDYPTGLWSPGEIIVDIHSLELATLPPGDYFLLAGLYNPATGERLPAFATEGKILPDYAVNVGQVTVNGQ